MCNMMKYRLDYMFVGLVALCVFLMVVLIEHAPPSTSSKAGCGTDHYSHWGSAIVWTHVGFELYRKPVRSLCLPPTSEDRAFALTHSLNPDDVCSLPGQNGRPIFINWNSLPRPYPPGVFLYFAPEAILYSFHVLDFDAVTLVSLLKLIIVAFITFYCFIKLLTETRIEKGKSYSVIDPFSFFILLPLAFGELVSFSLSRVYDPISILCIFLAILQLRRHQPLRAIVWCSLAIFLHFRALWWASLLLLSILEMSWTDLKVRTTWLFLIISTFLLSVAGYALWVLLPTLRGYAVSNPQYITSLTSVGFESATKFLMPVIVILLYLLYTRNWKVCLAVIWQVFMLLMTPEVQVWHQLSALPLLGIPMLEPEHRRHHAMVACCILFVLEVAMIFSGPLPLSWEMIGSIPSQL